MRLAAVLLLIALTLARAEPLPGADALLAELAARSSTNIVIRAEQLPDAPATALFGDLFDGPAGPAVPAAKAFLAKYGPVLGFPPGPDLPPELEVSETPAGDATSPQGHLVSFTPARDKVPYPSGTVKVQVLTSGKVTSATGRYRPLTNAEPGKLKAHDAVRRALSELAKEYPGSWLSGNGHVTEYFEDAPDGGVRHVYDLSLPIGAYGSSYRVVLGPGGEVLELGSGADRRAASGNVLQGYPTLSEQPVREPLKDLVDVSGFMSFKNRFLYGEHFEPAGSPPERAISEDGKFFYEPYTKKYYRKPEGDDPGARRPDPKFLEVHVYHHLTVAREKALFWKAKEVDNHVLTFDVWMKPKNPPDLLHDNNAMFESDKLTISFSSENNRYGFRHPAFDLSVLYHEYGHYVLWSVNKKFKDGGNKWSRYNAQAVNEGFADFFSSQITDVPSEGAWYKRGKWIRSTVEKLKYCEVAPPYVLEKKGDKLVQPSYSNAEIHDAGKCFSGLCNDLKDIVGKDEIMPMLIEAIRRSSTPTTFRNVCYAFLQVEQDRGGKRSERLQVAMKTRGMFDTKCDEPKFK